MIEYLAEYGLFLAKTLTLVAALLFAVASLVTVAMRHKKTTEKHLEITNLNRQYEEMESTCLLYTSPSPRDVEESRMPSSA